MKRRFFLFVCAFVCAAFVTTFAVANAAPDSNPSSQTESLKNAVCVVCGATQGAPPAPIGATAVYEGVTYPFCSKDCQSVFQQTPRRFLESDIGQNAPAFALKDRKGKLLKLSDFQGQVLLLDFWATWCPLCRELLPQMQAHQTRYAEKGFSIIGLASNSEPKEVDKTARSHKLTFPVAIANDAVTDAYKIIRLPTMVLIGRDGRIRQRFGPAADEKTITAAIEAALAEPAK